MKKIFKQSFSLILALMMVLSLVPVVALTANAEDFTPGATWTIPADYASIIQGAFTSGDGDYVYEADEAFDWKTWIATNKSYSGLQSKAVLSYNGQSVTKTASGISTTKGQNLQLWTPANFPEITADMYGNFTLTVEVYFSGKLVATGVLNFTRNAPVVETEPVETEPVEITYGGTFTPASGYEDKLNATFNTAEEDYIYEGTEAFDWSVTINNTYSKSIGVKVYATITTEKGQAVNKNKEMTLAVGENAAVDYTHFSELGTDVYGNFELKVTVTSMVNGAEKAVGQLIAVFGRVEADEPEQPEAPATPTKPGEVVWQYANSAENESYSWMNGAIKTENTTGIYKGWDAYDWAITLSPTKTAATITVEAEVIDHTGATVGTVTKDVEVGKAPAVTTILTAADLGLNNRTLGDFRVSAVIKYTNPETQTVTSMAQVHFVFGRRIGDVGYTAVEYLKGSEWINGSFTAVDEDMTYVGIQKYDWRATIAPTKASATVDVAVTVVNAQGETVATLNKTGVVCDRYATTALVTAGEIAELTTDLYGKFAITTVASIGGKAYVGIYGVIERVEGEFVADTVAPEFGPANWEGCEYPVAVTVSNNGEMNKEFAAKITITDAQGTVLIAKDVTHTVGAGASGELVTSNQLKQFITKRGVPYYVLIEGQWTNGYDVYDINETLTYVWAEHTDTEVVRGKAATCTESGLTDGVYCHGCEYTIVEQTEIPVDSEAHNFVDGTCACGATQELTDANLKFYRANASSPYGQLKLTGEVIAYVTAARKGYDSYYVVFTYLNKDTAVTVTAEPSSNSDANYVLFDCAIPAPLMTADITATIYGVKGGVAYEGETIVYTIRECVDAKLNMWYANYDKNAKIANMFDTLVNLLNYGAQAQIRFNVNTDKLATDGLPETYAAKIKTGSVELNAYPSVDESGKAATLYNMSFKLQEKINMYGNFLVKSGFTTESDYTVKIVHTKSDGSTTEYTIDNLTKSGNYLYFEFSQIAPAQMRDELQITLYKNDVAVSATYIRSGDRIVNTLPAALSALANAIMHYSDCAKAAFG